MNPRDSELLDAMIRIYALLKSTNPKLTIEDPNYVWKTIGRAEGIAWFQIEKEKSCEKYKSST